ncbi:ATP-dependent RNA helicase HrpA [Kineosporia sp. J2-2]|uniref:ATP-dependent RNA helicase HrpA n=1 Tax=Kineosporia corallincola TaxID=2835133 RepID=A0ABS5TDY5_9ACTN|nr:ATP-dependent RNA helicase HrpA [Kineosporia corallincola]MBT0769251.1 ATP-dependent RNA helicase HrpA [Kineosporia corallincola]
MSTETWISAVNELRSSLDGVSLSDARRLGRQLDSVQHARRRTEDEKTAELARIEREIGSATARVESRRASVPALTYPDQLPVSRRREDLLKTIAEHQVVIVAGETGSGKTTQLPKICLELGRGVRGMIGHTQPRRLAARSVAERITEEVGGQLGETIGYAVRFTDQVSDSTLVKLMTDGILLAEIQRDRLLSRYDTIIIDEAHERSLTIDFLLGYLKQLLPRRPDLKVVITSATIDPEAFSRHFDDAPIVEVSGRTYPVEVRYRPLVLVEETDEEGNTTEITRDPIEAVIEAVDELEAEGPGDVLVFFSGEREIRDAAEALNRHVGPSTEVVPLYARLSAAEQHRVFSPHSGRRIVLATNVAETSLTVPGIRYVIDPGTARISRYSFRTKVQRLPIEKVSQASANQRKGRCGRLSDGICIRLYSEEDFDSRPEFTDPEILRTNLAAVILQMTSLNLGEVERFPFLEPPDPRQIKDGTALLNELGAIDPEQTEQRKRLTGMGRTLAQLPVDPRLARMLVEADRNGCLADVLVIVSALSIQDPRERPTDKQAQADQSHARFKDQRSDFLSYVNLWNYVVGKQKEYGSGRFRRMCRDEFLHSQRIREWQDLHGQLRQVLRGAGIRVAGGRATSSFDPEAVDVEEHEDAVEPVSDATAEKVHLSLLSGLLSQVGLKEGETREYLGARSAKFAIQPGSALFRSTPRWVMVGELVETSRLWGRTAARIDPLWIERLGGHLVKRHYSEPRWEKKRGSAVATERVTLYGIPVVTGRTVGYGRIDPEVSRELFIRHALVEGEWRTNHQFFHENRKLLDDVGSLEDKVRRRDIVVDDQALFDFYDQRIPADVVSVAHFDSWWKKARRDRPDQLSFWTSMLFAPQAPKVSAEDYPALWPVGDLRLRVTYQFEPGTAADGVTVHLPLTALNQVREQDFEWQIPGLRQELVTELIRSLPKPIRKGLSPAPDRARAVLERLADTEPGSEPLFPALEDELYEVTGVDVPEGSWDLSKVPDHLKVTFRVEDDKGARLAEGKNLTALREKLKPRLRKEISSAVSQVEATGLTSFPATPVPRSVEHRTAGLTVQGYPALVDRGTHVDLKVLDDQGDQRRSMRAGTRRLIVLNTASPAKSVLARLSNRQKLALAQAPHKTPSDLFDDCLGAAVDDLVDRAGGPAWDRAGFERLLLEVRQEIHPTVTGVLVTTSTVLGLAREIELGLKSTSSPALLPGLTDLRSQLAALVFPGFVTATGAGKLPDLVRYLQAIQRRLERLPDRHQRDRGLQEQVLAVRAEFQAAVAKLPPSRRRDDDVIGVRWMLEELRVGLFGGGLKTAYPVSEQRVRKAIADLA